MKKIWDTEKNKINTDNIRDVLLVVSCVCFAVGIIILGKHYYDVFRVSRQTEELKEARDQVSAGSVSEDLLEVSDDVAVPYDGAALKKMRELYLADEIVVEDRPGMLPEYEVLYEQNPDICGWLYIEGTVIDYPVMQTPEDEDYYLHRDFYKKNNANGSLIMDADSVVGTGTAKRFYTDGTVPGTNLIIHGHHLIVNAMFGKLVRYEKEAYGKEHSTICFDSLYEKRKYELIAAFYTQVYEKDADVFKYYEFFQADTEEEFNYFYDNIKRLSLYDTGVTAVFGDEFITLSTCSYQTETGRFVVIGKRVE